MLEHKLLKFNWFFPTRVVFGTGSLDDLPSVVDDLVDIKARIFLVTGRHNLRSTGVLSRVLNLLTEHTVTLFDRVTPFPSLELVDMALAECRDVSADIVIAVGGGSALDLAKAVSVLMLHEGSAPEFAKGQKTLERRGIPFVAVPTTSGSSSEVTSGSAFWDMDKKQSVGIKSSFMFPNVALVDPDLTMTMSKNLAANTGMDAFTSAFESYWSTEAQPLSDLLHLEVIQLFSEHLEASCNEVDKQSRSACALASTLSGIGYSNSRPNVCHAVGSPLTLFWNVAHGQSVGLTLTTFLRSQAEAISPKLPQLWEAMNVSGLEEAIQRLTDIMQVCGLQTRLSGLGITEPDLDTLIDNINWDRLDTLPKSIGKGTVGPLLRRLL